MGGELGHRTEAGEFGQSKVIRGCVAVGDVSQFVTRPGAADQHLRENQLVSETRHKRFECRIGKRCHRG